MINVCKKVLSEVSNPRHTLTIAAPTAIILVTTLYTLTNLAYFAAISSSQMRSSGVIIAAVFFRNVFGDSTLASTALPAFVALSNAGNVLAVTFSHSRMNQEFAKERLLPFSDFFASNKPRNAPAGALLLHGVVSVVVLLAPPPGKAYEFLVDLYSYAPAVLGVLTAAGLLYLKFEKKENWKSPYTAYTPTVVLWGTVNLFLVVAPFIPPSEEQEEGDSPYYLLPVVAWCTLGFGVGYWVVWWHLLPRWWGERVEVERVLEGGVEVVKVRKVKLR
jgi:amino acid transporter